MRILKILLLMILIFSLFIPFFVFADDISDNYFNYISFSTVDDRLAGTLFQLDTLYYVPNGSFIFESGNSLNRGIRFKIYDTDYLLVYNYEYLGLDINFSSGVRFFYNNSDIIKIQYTSPSDNQFYVWDYFSPGVLTSQGFYEFFGLSDVPIPSLIPFTGEGITIPAGYCCVIDRAFNEVVSTQTYSPLPDYAYLTCVTNEKSPLVGDWVTGASYGYQNNLDLSNLSSLNTINWVINPNKEKTGLFNNRSYNAFKEIITNTSSRYILISNPPYSNYSSENNTFVSPTITINFVNYDGTPYHGFCGWYKLYRYDSLNNHSYVISEDNSIPWQGEVNESGDGYTQQGWGEYYTTPSPQLGGTPISSSDSSNNLIDILSRYFGLGQEKVDQLSSQGQGFFSFLSNLFSWMPSELINIVSSLFIIFLSVACIKLFL